MRIELRYDDAAARAALHKAPDVVLRMLGGAIERGAQELAREARDKAPKAFSTLTNSIRALREGDLHWSVAPGVNYAPFVEGGRMPMRKMPPKGSLLAWIKFRLKVGEKAAERMEYVIARAIQRQGIKPQPFMAPAFEAKKGRVVELANEAMRRAVAEINGGVHGAA